MRVLDRRRRVGSVQPGARSRTHATGWRARVGRLFGRLRAGRRPPAGSCRAGEARGTRHESRTPFHESISAQAFTTTINPAMTVVCDKALGATACNRSSERRGYADSLRSRTLAARVGEFHRRVSRTRGVPNHFGCLEKGLRSSSSAALPVHEPAGKSRMLRRSTGDLPGVLARTRPLRHPCDRAPTTSRPPAGTWIRSRWRALTRLDGTSPPNTPPAGSRGFPPTAAPRTARRHPLAQADRGAGWARVAAACLTGPVRRREPAAASRGRGRRATHRVP